MQCSALLNRLDRYTCSTPANSMQRVSVDAEARREAVEAAGEAVKRSLDANIRSASFGGRVRQHTWHGRAVTARQVTGWLERGHGTGTIGHMETVGTKRIGGHTRKARWGPGYVAGRQFYAYTKDDALDIALKAADKVLCRIADKVDF